MRAKVAQHPVEETGTKLRELMSWVQMPAQSGF